MVDFFGKLTGVLTSFQPWKMRVNFVNKELASMRQNLINEVLEANRMENNYSPKGVTTNIQRGSYDKDIWWAQI